jgi:hypothetical protein
VFSTRPTATHWGPSKQTMHSVLWFNYEVCSLLRDCNIGHKGSQAKQLAHCEAMILNGIDTTSHATLPHRGVAALDVPDLTAFDFMEIAPEPADRRFLDGIVRVLIDRLDPSIDRNVSWAATNLGHKYSMAVVDGADDARKPILLAISALAVNVDTTVPDEFDAGCREFVYLELPSMPKTLINEARAFGATAARSLTSLISPASSANSFCLVVILAAGSSSILA